MKRYICLIAAVILCLSLTACKKGDPTPEEINEETLKVGVICTTEAEDLSSEAAAFKDQIFVACRSMGLLDDQMVLRDDISATNSAIAETAIEECVQDGCAVIFGTAPGFADAMKKKAAEYPRVTFVGLGDADSSLTNYYAFRIKMYDGAYFCGLIAGIQSKSGKLGMIAPNASSAETCQIANAFLLGARVKNPAATVSIVSIDAAQSSTKEEAAVQRLHEEECDTVLITTKGSAALDAATKKKMKSFSLYAKPIKENDLLLYSVTPRLTDMFVDTMQAVLSDQQPYYNDMYVGYIDGFLQWQSGSSTEVVGDTHVLPGAVQSYMHKEDWDPFCGEVLSYELTELKAAPAAVKDADGEEKIAASAGTPTKEVLNNMTWLTEGVTLLK